MFPATERSWIAARNWLAEEACDNFMTVFDAALAGEQQVVTRQDGREVIVVARDSPAKARPTVKDFLLTGGFMEDDEADAFDRILKDIRGEEARSSCLASPKTPADQHRQDKKAL